MNSPASSDLFQRLSEALVRHAPNVARLEPRLAAALAQLAGNPGKLLRAQLVLVAAETHGLAPAAAEQLACAVEYFHLASLAIDDLPCMDDAETRRGLTCVHRIHGPATAILAALAFINRAYALVGEAFARQPQGVRAAATRLVDGCLGAGGLVGGQAWDLAFQQTDGSPAAVCRIAHAKTGALFRLAILLPALPGRPSAAERRALNALCVYWGQQFQITDDLRDELTSSVSSGKTTGRDRALSRPNFVLAAGVPSTRARLARLARQSTRALAELTAASPRWRYLQSFSQGIAPSLVTVPEMEHAAA